MKKRCVKKAIVCVALLAALCAGTIAPQTRSLAMDPVDTAAKCTLTVQMSETDVNDYWDLVSEAEKNVFVYKVADISKSASFELVGKLKDRGITIPNGSDATTTDWEEAAKEISEALGLPYVEEDAQTSGEGAYDPYKVGENDPIEADRKTQPSAVMEATDQMQMGAGNSSCTFKDLDTGLYLVYIAKDWTTRNVYTFQPYLVSVPNNLYYTLGKNADVPEDLDQWDYTVDSVLKARQDPRFGEVVIKKHLQTYDLTQGPVMFSFKVDAYLSPGPNDPEELVYSNVLDVEFNEKAGTLQAAETGKVIPAGARIVVTEIYSGASYELKAGQKDEFDFKLVPRNEPGENEKNGEAADYGTRPFIEDDISYEVEFTNDYTPKAGWGTGAENNYTNTSGNITHKGSKGSNDKWDQGWNE